MTHTTVERRCPQPAAVTPLEPDLGCWRHQSWGCRLLGEIDAHTVIARLAPLGYEIRCRHPALTVVRNRRGDEIAWAHRTGRVQIRVDLARSPNARPEAARCVHHELEETLRAIGTRPERSS